MMPSSSDEFPFRQRAENAPTAADQDLAAHVAARLRRESLMPEDHVVVSVQNGVVILEGIVGRRSLVERLHRATWQVAGVIDVSNQLSAWDGEADERW